MASILKLTPSPYQQAVFDFVRTGRGSAFVKAVAGSGKSTTILIALAYITAGLKVTFVAFNKKIVQELQRKIDEMIADLEQHGTGIIDGMNVNHMIRNLREARVSTFHSIGLGAWRYRNKNTQVNGDKLDVILNSSGEFTPDEVRMYGSLARRMVSIAKGIGIGCLVENHIGRWFDIIDHHGFELDDDRGSMEDCITIAQRLLRLSNDWSVREVSPVIDFDDMLYMPIMANTGFYAVDMVMVDEAQDVNPIQIAMLHRMIKKGSGRLIAVGDPKQAIYGFRGADSAAVEKIISEFRCIELPLTVSYRCAKSIVRSAQHLVPYLEAFEGSPEGEVIQIKEKDVEWRPTDAIICRLNAPLISMAMKLIGRRTPCKVLGRDIGVNLVRLVKKLRAENMDDLLARLQVWEDKERARLLQKGKDAQADAVTDRAECIRAVIGEDLDMSVPALIGDLEAMFSDDSSDDILTLSSVHKFKGSERDRVYILAPEKMQLKARKDWQIQGEMNVEYVARTRAKTTLGMLVG